MFKGKVEILKLTSELWSSAINKANELLNLDGKVRVGILTLPPGERLPSTGQSVHEEYEEMAYVVSGKLLFVADGREYVIEEGSFMYNPRGTPHYTKNLSDSETRVLWVLVRA